MKMRVKTIIIKKNTSKITNKRKITKIKTLSLPFGLQYFHTPATVFAFSVCYIFSSAWLGLLVVTVLTNSRGSSSLYLSVRRSAGLVSTRRKRAHTGARGWVGWTVLQPTGRCYTVMRTHLSVGYLLHNTLKKRVVTELKFNDLIFFYTPSTAIKQMKRFLKSGCQIPALMSWQKYHHRNCTCSAKIPFASYCNHNKLLLLYLCSSDRLIQILSISIYLPNGKLY